MGLSAFFDATPAATFPEWHREVMDAFEEVAILSAGSTAIDDVLRLVGRRMCDLLELSRCWVYLRREDGQFQGHVGYCSGGESIDESVSRMVAGIAGDGFTAEIIRSASPVVTQDAARDPRTISRIMRSWGVRDLLGIPLILDDQVIGIIYVDDEGRRHHYTDHDIQVAQAFASLTSLVVRKSWLYNQLVERAEEVERQRSVLTRSGAMQTAMNRATVEGAGATEIVDLLAEHLMKPVVLYDDDLRVTAWSPAPGSRCRIVPGVPDALRHSEWATALLTRLEAGIAVSAPRPELPHRGMFIRLKVKDEPLGYLEVCEIGHPFNPVDSRALAHAAFAVSLAMMVSRRNKARRAYRLREFLHLMTGLPALDDDVRKAFSETDLDPEDRYGIIYLQFEDDHGAASTTSAERREAVVSILEAKVAESTDLRLVGSIGIGRADVILYAVPAAAPQRAVVTETVDEAMGSLRRIAGVRFAVVSSAYPDPVDLPGAVDDARTAASALRSMRCESSMIDLDDLAMVQLLHRNDGLEGAARYARRMLRPLYEYDAAQNGSLVETLRAFVSAQTNMKAASLALGVHENTIRYRLNRIQAISTIDPEQFDDLVRARTALQLLSLVEVDPAPEGGPRIHTPN